jgi:hypothetical protein
MSCAALIDRLIAEGRALLSKRYAYYSTPRRVMASAASIVSVLGWAEQQAIRSDGSRERLV